MDITLGIVLEKNIYESYVYGAYSSIEMRENIEGEMALAPIPNPSERYWRTDFKLGRNIYALLSNDVKKASPQDPLIGVMETSEMAENVVDTHNLVIERFGRHYVKALGTNF